MAFIETRFHNFDLSEMRCTNCRFISRKIKNSDRQADVVEGRGFLLCGLESGWRAPRRYGPYHS